MRIHWRCGSRARGTRAIDVPIVIAALCLIVGLTLAPRGYEAGELLAIQDDPSAMAGRIVDKSFSPGVADREIRSALDADDVDLANSFVDLAHERNVPVDPALAARVADANSITATATRHAQKFARGLVIGEPDDAVSLAGTALGDLFVFGDVRDAVREGSRLATGQNVDGLILGLSCVGLAVTAGTYAMFGLGTPARVGLSVVKAARKTGHLGDGLAVWLGRSVRQVVDTASLRKTLATASLAEPAVAVRAAREAIKFEKAGALTRFAGDVGRIQAKAGTRAAMDGLKLAETPRDVSRLATLAEKQGSKTRAILKLAGRGAIAFSLATFHLASWMFSILVALFTFCAAVKSATEKTTLKYVRYRKRRRERARLREAERAVAAQTQRGLALAPAPV
jgi:hypothetical protein